MYLTLSMSVQSIKSDFLRSQINGVLSQPLNITEESAGSLAPDLPLQAIRDVTAEVNRLVSVHFARTYFPLAVQSVAQQIDQLYWDEAAPEPDDSTHGKFGPSFSASLTTSEGLASLPENWSQDADYHDKMHRLQELHAQRDALLAKMASLQKLAHLIEPYEGPQESVQPNLVARDGDLVEELGRTRNLTARFRALASHPTVSADCENLPRDEGDTISQTQKLQALLQSR